MCGLPILGGCFLLWGGQDRRQAAPDSFFSLLGFIPLKSLELCQGVITHFVTKYRIQTQFFLFSPTLDFGWAKLMGEICGAVENSAWKQCWQSVSGYTSRSCMRVLKCCCAEEESLGIIPVRQDVTRVSLSLLPGHLYWSFKNSFEIEDSAE